MRERVETLYILKKQVRKIGKPVTFNLRDFSD